MRNATAIGALVVFLAGCGSADEEFTDCRIGELTGAWRMTYAETNGNCGAIADETAIFDPNSGPTPGCVVHSSSVSADKCEGQVDSECAFPDGDGSVRWVMVLDQISPAALSGTGTVQVSSSQLTCRSTYNLDMTRL